MQQYIPHLIELRRRLIRATFVLFVIFIFLFYFDEWLFYFLATRMIDGQNIQLISTEVTATFTVPMKLALVMSLFLSAPYWLFEIWRFVAPGLYKKEKRFLLPALFTSILLFYLGSLFSFFCICPMALKFFADIAPKGVWVATDIRHYLDFVLTLLLGGGIAFQVPVITWILLVCNIISVEMLTHLRPYVIVGAFVIGMLLTPPDVLSQIMLAIPMWGLFEVGLWLGRRWKKHRLVYP